MLLNQCSLNMQFNLRTDYITREEFQAMLAPITTVEPKAMLSPILEKVLIIACNPSQVIGITRK